MISAKTIDAIYLSSFKTCIQEVGIDEVLRVAILFRVPNIEELKHSALQKAIANSYVGKAFMVSYYNAQSPEDVRMLIENSQCYMILDTLGYDIYKIDFDDAANILFKDFQTRKERKDPFQEDFVITAKKKRRDWTDEEEAFLKKNHIKHTREELAEMLGRPITSVSSKLSRMGLVTGQKAEWSETEIAFLKENYGHMPIEDIAKKLGRSYDSVTSKAAFRRLNLIAN